MVVQRNPQLRRRFRNILGDRDILPARFGAAAWMVVDEDERRGAEFERSEEHTSELQSLMRISYAVFCLKKKKNNTQYTSQQCQTTTKSHHNSHMHNKKTDKINNIYA